MALIIPGLDQVAPGKNIKSSILVTAFNAVSSKFSFGINGQDVDPNGNFPGTMLAARTVAADRLIAGTLTQTEMGLLCTGTPQLRDAEVTKGKISTTPGLRITKAQLEVTLQAIALTSYTANSGYNTVTPLTPIPKAANSIIGAYPLDVGISAGTLNSILWYIDDTGANYLVKLAVTQGTPVGTPTLTGSFVLVSLALT